MSKTSEGHSALEIQIRSLVEKYKWRAKNSLVVARDEKHPSSKAHHLARANAYERVVEELENALRKSTGRA